MLTALASDRSSVASDRQQQAPFEAEYGIKTPVKRDQAKKSGRNLLPLQNQNSNRSNLNNSAMQAMHNANQSQEMPYTSAINKPSSGLHQKPPAPRLVNTQKKQSQIKVMDGSSSNFQPPSSVEETKLDPPPKSDPVSASLIPKPSSSFQKYKPLDSAEQPQKQNTTSTNGDFKRMEESSNRDSATRSSHPSSKQTG